VRPDYAPARILKAALDTGDKNYTLAEQELASLAKDHPENSLVYRQMAVYDETRGEPADAEKDLLKALEIQPDSQDALRELTLFYIRQKQPGRAIEKISAVPESKKQAFHYELLALAYSQAGKSEEAENSFKTAVAKDPNRSSSEVRLFAEYMKKGQTEDGVKVLDEMAKKNPSDGGTFAIKGIIMEQQGKTEEAKQ